MKLFSDPCGKRSMARFVAFLFAVDATVVALVVAYYIARGKAVGDVVHGAAAVIAALVGAGAVAIINRVKGSGPSA